MNREVESVDVVSDLLAVAPGAEQSSDVARIRGGALRVDHLEARFAHRLRGHQVRTKRRLASFVANLTDSHIGRLRPRGAGEQREQNADD
jgi:hypothetical protein